MNYWFVNLPREDMEHCMKIGTFGLNSKQSMGRIEPGDALICCVTKENPWKIIGFGEITTALYVDDKPIFKKPGDFWYRFDFKAKPLRSDQEIDAQSLMSELSFVTNYSYWPVYFKGGVKSIPKIDYDLVRSKLS